LENQRRENWGPRKTEARKTRDGEAIAARPSKVRSPGWRLPVEAANYWPRPVTEATNLQPW